MKDEEESKNENENANEEELKNEPDVIKEITEKSDND